MALCYGALWFYAATNRRLIAEGADQRTVSGISRSFAPGSLVYALATLSSLISADLAVALYALIALFYVFESSLFGRDSSPGPLLRLRSLRETWYFRLKPVIHSPHAPLPACTAEKEGER